MSKAKQPGAQHADVEVTVQTAEVTVQTTRVLLFRRLAPEAMGENGVVRLLNENLAQEQNALRRLAQRGAPEPWYATRKKQVRE